MTNQKHMSQKAKQKTFWKLNIALIKIFHEERKPGNTLMFIATNN